MDYSNNISAQDLNIPNNPVPVNRTNQTLIFITLILSLIAVGGVGFLLAKYLYSPKPTSKALLQQSVIPPLSPTNSFSNLNAEKVATVPASVDETAGWKEFTSPKYKFSFKYPAEWETKEAVLQDKTTTLEFTKAYEGNGQNYNIWINMAESSRPANIVDYVKENAGELVDYTGQPGKYLETPLGKVFAYDSAGDGGYFYTTILVRQNLILKLYLNRLQVRGPDFENGMKTSNQILSTFKFL